MLDGDGYDEEVIGPAPPWLHLLSQVQRDWRATQILNGRDPDGYIEERLREEGQWPMPSKDNSDA